MGHSRGADDMFVTMGYLEGIGNREERVPKPTNKILHRSQEVQGHSFGNLFVLKG